MKKKLTNVTIATCKQFFSVVGSSFPIQDLSRKQYDITVCCQACDVAFQVSQGIVALRLKTKSSQDVGLSACKIVRLSLCQSVPTFAIGCRHFVKRIN